MKVETLSFEHLTGWDKKIPFHLDSPNTLILVFGASSFLEDQEPLEVLVGLFPQSKITGCSTAGEILGQNIYENSLRIAILNFEKTELSIASAPVDNAEGSFIAGQKLAAELFTLDLKGVIVFSDGLNVNGSKLVEGINSVLPPSVVVSGGLAGDKDRFDKTWVLNNGKLQGNVVTAVGLYGKSVNIGHGSKGGWDIFGHERRVTKSKDNVLFELDGKPALQIYKNYLGERAAELPASALLFPLAVRTDKDDEKQIVRTILGVDEETQSMTFAGDIPEGSLAQLMRANFDRLITGAANAAEMTRSDKLNKGGDMLCLSISCVGRRLILGERAEEELEAVSDFMPPGVTQIGFYSYGEISASASGYCDLHNQSMTITTIAEA